MGRHEDPALCGQLVPLPSQEAGAAAELDKEFPFAEPVGLHHLTEGLIGWQQERKGGIRLWILLRFHCSLLARHRWRTRQGTQSLMSHFNTKVQ